MTIDLVTALSKAQSEMTSAELDGRNPGFKRNGNDTKYATLDSVVRAVRGPLTKHGIAYVQRVEQTPDGLGVETTFHGHGSSLPTGLVVVPIEKRTAQGMGSALSYGRRYSLMLACGISAADEDDDGEAAEGNAPAQIISTEQAAEIKAELQATGSDTLGFLKAMGGYGSVDEIRSSGYERAMKMLEKKRASMGASNATRTG